ncbi:MAG: DUF3109 family protein [Bacteroidales bacterium]
MIVIDDILVSDDIRDIRFCCDLDKCFGACCVEGDAGAPLEEEEISHLEDDIDVIRQYMSKEGVEVIENLGVFDFDMAGEYVTPLINDRDCAYIYYENDIARCAIEKAYEEKAISFQKPVSCHLYPIRIVKKKNFEAVNYHKWYICSPACSLGKELGLPLYKFLKVPLTRKYGEEWYAKLVREIERKGEV